MVVSKQVHNINDGGNNVVNPSSDGIDIYDGLGDLGNLNSFGDYIPPTRDQMLGGDEMQYLELMDLDEPLDWSTEGGGYEQVHTGGLYANGSRRFDSEDLYCIANRRKSANFVHETAKLRRTREDGKKTWR